MGKKIFRQDGDIKALPLRDFSMTPIRTREVVLPRFKLEQNYDLIDHLKEMGLTDLFKESGDLSEMTSEKVSINWVRLNPSLFFFTLLPNVCLVIQSPLSPAINNPHGLKNNDYLLISNPS